MRFEELQYRVMHRLGYRPWERYHRLAADSIAARLDAEEQDRTPPFGRALDLGCGRGLYTAELGRRGWDAVGVDVVPTAIRAAQREHAAHARFVLGDVTRLAGLGLGRFDLFFDVGCLQSLDADGRAALGRGVTALATSGASLLVNAFDRTRLAPVIGGITADEVTAAFPDWQLLVTEAAPVTGLGWPMNTTSPRWYRLRFTGPRSECYGA